MLFKKFSNLICFGFLMCFSLFLAALGLCCYVGFSLIALSGSYSGCVNGLLIAVVVLVVEHRLQDAWALGAAAQGLSNCGAWA